MPNAITAPEPNNDRVTVSPTAVKPYAKSGNKRGKKIRKDDKVEIDDQYQFVVV